MTTPQGRLGKWREEHARRYLEGKSYKVSATNYRSRWGEVDIIAQLGEEMVFVEVEIRREAAFGTPEESVTATKAQRLIATVQGYLQKNSLEQAPWRADLVSISPDEQRKLLRLEHMENAEGE